MRISREKLKSGLIEKVEEISGEKLAVCYQCGKCSAGCPLESEMEILPHRVIRLLQLGSEDEALGSSAIWLCASCHTCAARCPKGVDLSKIMEALRVILLRRGYHRVEPADVPPEVLEKAPQQAIVSCYRKFNS